jgi:pimeloyl-ACP methyl ester carboxylesterase
MRPEQVIFLPGLLCDSGLWQAQLDGLTVDLDTKVADLTRASIIKELAHQVLDEAPQHFAVVGLSMGGYVAQEIVRQVPDRVTHLALINTSARPDTPETKERRAGLIALAHHGKFKGVTPRLLPMLLNAEHLENVAMTKLVMDMAERVGRDAFIRQQRAILSRIDSRPTLPQFPAQMHTLVIGGAQDALTPPEHAEEMASLIPGAKLVILDECGHLAPIEQPQRVTALLDGLLQA